MGPCLDERLSRDTISPSLLAFSCFGLQERIFPGGKHCICFINVANFQ